MKKMLIAILLLLIFITNVYAYTIETQDTHAYTMMKGKMLKETPTRGQFGVDEEKGIITELHAIAKVDGREIDFAKYNPGFWNIVSKSNGTIVATKIDRLSEQLLVFRSNGTYYLFQAFHDTPLPDGVDKLISSVFYGNYKRID